MFFLPGTTEKTRRTFTEERTSPPPCTTECEGRCFFTMFILLTDFSVPDCLNLCDGAGYYRNGKSVERRRT